MFYIQNYIIIKSGNFSLIFSKLSALLTASVTAGAGSMNLSPSFVFLVLVLPYTVCF